MESFSRSFPLYAELPHVVFKMQAVHDGPSINADGAEQGMRHGLEFARLNQGQIFLEDGVQCFEIAALRVFRIHGPGSIARNPYDAVCEQRINHIPEKPVALVGQPAQPAHGIPHRVGKVFEHFAGRHATPCRGRVRPEFFQARNGLFDVIVIETNHNGISIPAHFRMLFLSCQ